MERWRRSRRKERNQKIKRRRAESGGQTQYNKKKVSVGRLIVISETNPYMSHSRSSCLVDALAGRYLKRYRYFYRSNDKVHMYLTNQLELTTTALFIGNSLLSIAGYCLFLTPGCRVLRAIPSTRLAFVDMQDRHPLHVRVKNKANGSPRPCSSKRPFSHTSFTRSRPLLSISSFFFSNQGLFGLLLWSTSHN